MSDMISTDEVMDEARDLRGHIHDDGEHGVDHDLYCVPAANMLEALAKERDNLRAALAAAQAERDEALEKADKLRDVLEGSNKNRARLIAERDTLRKERDGAYSLFPPLLQQIDRALNGPDPDDLTVRGYTTLPERARTVVAALTEARRVLRICEWGKRDGWCRACNKFEEEGHAHDCALAAVLAQEEQR